MTYRSIASLLAAVEDDARSLPGVVLQQEVDESGVSEDAIRQRLRRSLEVMEEAMEEGLKGDRRSASGLTGGRAAILDAAGPRLLGAETTSLIARAVATLETNAAMGLIVAAPTAGAAGVLPAVLTCMGERLELDREQLMDGLLVAGGIGSVIAHRASLSGAEGGCQAETGSAAAMAAAAVTWLAGGGRQQVSNSVAFALQGMLGLICDPIGGLVEIPCIYRNASAAVQAVAAAEMALAGLEFPVTADEVIDVMGEVGRRMPVAYRETAQGGLAATASARRLVRGEPANRPTGASA